NGQVVCLIRDHSRRFAGRNFLPRRNLGLRSDLDTEDRPTIFPVIFTSFFDASVFSPIPRALSF
ncbi:MAG TPA: hypothetical protein PKM58_09770, partial [Pyrinomonadaceae bacterium]|nr:hypothetical protein [Pyrinomonadaceae bacterium]